MGGGEDFVVGEFEIPALEVEFHLFESSKESPASVFGEFGVVLVGEGRGGGLADEAGGEKRGSAENSETGETMAVHGGGVIGDAEHARFFQPENHETCEDDDCGNDHTHRVGFGNVAPNFLGPDEVVDGDEIKARAEFIPEEPFRSGDKNEDAGVNNGEGGEGGEGVLCPACFQDSFRKEDSEEQPWSGGEDACGDIEEDPDYDCAEGWDAGADFTPGSDQQGDAGKECESEE